MRATASACFFSSSFGSTGSRAGSNPPDGPEVAIAFSLPITPPQYSGLSTRSRNGNPIGTSYTPGRFTSPLIEKSRRPPKPGCLPSPGTRQPRVA